MDAARIFIPQFQKFAQKGIGIQLKKSLRLGRGYGIIKIVMLRKTHFVKPQPDSSENHFFHGRVGISRKGSM